MNYKPILLISIAIVTIAALIAAFVTTNEPSTTLPERLPTFEWNHYTDPEYVKFEIDYPSYISPALERDGDLYSVVFGDELVVASSPIKHSAYDPNMSPFGNPDDVLVETVTIASSTASVFRTALPNGQLSEDFSVTLHANGRLYTLFFPRPHNAEKMLESFGVL